MRLRRWLGWPNNSYRPSEQLTAAIGGLLGVLIVWQCCHLLLGPAATPLIVPSLGASAVLVFAVPHSPLTQPWAVFGGHVISAVVGVTCQLCIPHPGLAAACAVGGAILAMHLARCIHPPGGATALAAVIGGSSIHALGYRYALTPIALTALLLLALGVAYNYVFPWRRYPQALMRHAVALHKPLGLPHISQADITAAMAAQRVVLDIGPEELGSLIDDALRRALGHPQASTPELRLHGVYSNNRSGPEWSVRQIVDTRPSETPAFDMVIYVVLEGPGKGRHDSCTRREFLAWAQSELHP